MFVGWRRRAATSDWIALVALAGLAALYFWRLDAWLINDDEGSYLYAAWRVSLGELPYRDFLTPQLPAFLLSGGLVFRALGASVVVGRSLAVCLTLLGGVILWATVRRLFGSLAALTAGLVLLLHPDIYLHCRTFRPEPFMLLATCLGLYSLARATGTCPSTALGCDDGQPRLAPGLETRPDLPRRRLWYVAGGLALGVGILCKLFAVLPLAGCLAWLLHDGWAHRRPWRATLLEAGLLAGTAGMVAAGGLGLFSLVGTPIWTAVLGHHLMQGAGLSPIEVWRKACGLYAEFLRYNNNALVALLALAVATVGVRRRWRGVALFAWQLPTALVFFFLTRELWTRHLIYLLPSLAALFGVAVRWTADKRSAAPSDWAGSAQRLIGGALVLAFVVPALLVDRDTGWRWEDGTWRLADFVTLSTSPAAVVLSDYSELNFYARRPTTYSAASLSAGAAKSGQITWRRLRGELEQLQPLPPLVLVDRTRVDDQEYGQLRFLHDLPDFEAWLAESYERVGVFRRDPQQFEVYRRRGAPVPILAAIEKGPSLLAAAIAPPTVGVGEAVVVTTAWRSAGPTVEPLMMTLRLVDAEGREWAQADRALTATRRRLTHQWLADELTADRGGLVIPPGTPPGSYEVRLSLYEFGRLEPLELRRGDGAPLGPAVVVGAVEVRPWLASRQKAERALGLAGWPGGAPTDPSAVVRPPAVRGQWGGLELLGTGPLPQAELLAGSIWTSDLWWRAGARLGDVQVRVQLAPPARSEIGGEAVRELGQPGLASSRWPVGTVARQQIEVPILPWAEAGVYDVRLEVQELSGQSLGQALVIGQVRLRSRDTRRVATTAPPVQRQLAARFGSLAELYGVRLYRTRQVGRRAADQPSLVLAQLAPGEPLVLELTWHVLAPAARSYHVTAQLVDAAGRIAAQHDGVPAGGERPTTSWLPGEYLTDRHELVVGADCQPGRYELIVALYDPLTMERQVVSGPDANPQARSAVVGAVLVEPVSR